MAEVEKVKLAQVPVKKPWQSKTNWVAVINAVLAFFPPVLLWVSEHPDVYVWGLSMVILGLRQVTDGKIDIK